MNETTQPRGTPSLTLRILEEVESTTGIDTLDLPPLANAVDPEALQTVVESIDSGNVTFRYHDLQVTVDSDGTVDVTDGTNVAPNAQDSNRKSDPSGA